VTGAITASDIISMSKSDASNFYGVQSRNTNTGAAASNGFAVGNNSSAFGLTLTLNSSNFTAANNYAYLLNQFNAPLILGSNGTGQVSISTTGLAVTGLISSTGNLNVSGAGGILTPSTGTSALSLGAGTTSYSS